MNRHKEEAVRDMYNLGIRCYKVAKRWERLGDELMRDYHELLERGRQE